MAERTVQLVLHYDGARFAGWQRQPAVRTVQGELETVLSRLCDRPTRATGAGRTDAGVHARGQSAGVSIPPSWTPERLQRALNALLPDDIWVAAVYDMHENFHARYSALARRYSYRIGTDAAAQSPFRVRWEWAINHRIDVPCLERAASAVLGEHTFRAYAVQGTAPASDDHRCLVSMAQWVPRSDAPGLVFEIEANRFLHHMVRFLVGTMIGEAAGIRTVGTVARLLTAPTNEETSPPAPPHALVLEAVRYPETLYCSSSPASPTPLAA